jgi:hypothetical protein
MNLKSTTLALVAILFCFNPIFSANTKWTWEGNVNSSWTTKANWITTDGDAQVGALDTVIIDAGAAVYPSLSGNVTVKTIIMNGGWFFVNGYTVTVSSDIVINSGEFNGYGSSIVAANVYVYGGGIGVIGDQFPVSNNIVVDGGLLIVFANDLDVIQNLTLSSGTLDLNGNSMTVGNQYTYEGGDIINVATFNINKMVVDFTGIDTLNYNLNIGSSLQLINGVIKTSSSSMFIFDFDATTTGTSNASHVNGPVRRLVATSGNLDFTFPIGNGTVAAPVTISDFIQTDPQDYFTAQYFKGPIPNAYNRNSKDVTLNHVGGAEYWILDRANTIGSPTTDVNVRLTYDETTRSGIVDSAKYLRVARWDGTAWRDHGRDATTVTGNNVAGSLRTSSRVTSFSPFTLASSTSLNPLPVSLIDFQAVPAGKQVKVSWTTTEEINNDFFTVQKSLDGKNWSVIGIVKAAEYSGAYNTYSLMDKTPVNGIQYYRLIQTDMKANSTTSHIVSVKFAADALPTTLSLYPNPVNNVLSIGLNESASDANITVFNSMGIKVMELHNLAGANFVLDMTDFEKGVYTVEVQYENGVNYSKILKN